MSRMSLWLASDRWLYMVIEQYYSEEILNEDYLNTKDNKILTWADIELSRLLTYNKTLDAYRYEINDFEGLKKKIDVFDGLTAGMKQQLREDTYQWRYNLVWEGVIWKNKKVLETFFKGKTIKICIYIKWFNEKIKNSSGRRDFRFRIWINRKWYILSKKI